MTLETHTSVSARPDSPALRSETVVTVEHLAFSYGREAALRDISFSVARGEAVALLGHNGAGKTTTIRLLNGLLRPDGGHLSVLGMDPTVDGHDLRRRTSVVTDSLGLHDRETPRKIFTYHARLWGLDVDATLDKGHALLERFGLADHVDVTIKSFSRGMRQRLAIARSLLNDPELLLLDEPTLGMDPVARQDFRELLRDLRDRGTAVVVSTHDLGEVQRVCDRLVILQHGRTVIEGTPQECIRPHLAQMHTEIECDEPIGPVAREALRSVDGLSRLRIDNSLIDFVAASPGAVADAVAALAANGARVSRVGSQAPSLEDVYLRIHDVNGSEGAA